MTTVKARFAVCILAWASVFASARGGALIIDHENTDITQLTTGAIQRAKSVLHIAYGHTSHGSQLTVGMTGLIGFANGHGKGLYFPANFFSWNNGGTGGALDLHDYAMGGDVGYWPDWYNNTVSYLNDPSHADVNVIIWSWCGQMDDKYQGGTLSNEYLLPMSSLETSYPDVVFVYMTGHAPDDGNMSASLDNRTKAACQAIKDYCIANNKVFYDFNDIEHYNPDGTYFKFVTDSCDYYATNSGSPLGNWATEWQDSHTENVDWYDCGAAHSVSLNANQKAYAAWHLWCALAADLDRDDIGDEWEERYGNASMFRGGTNDWDRDGVTDYEEFVADSVPTNGNSFLRLTGLGHTNSCTVSFPCSTGRLYSLQYVADAMAGSWNDTDGAVNVQGHPSGTLALTDTNDADHRLYRVGVALP